MAPCTPPLRISQCNNIFYFNVHDFQSTADIVWMPQLLGKNQTGSNWPCPVIRKQNKTSFITGNTTHIRFIAKNGKFLHTAKFHTWKTSFHHSLIFYTEYHSYTKFSSTSQWRAYNRSIHDKTTQVTSKLCLTCQRWLYQNLPSWSVNFISLVTSCDGLQEEVTQTTHPMFPKAVSHIATSMFTGR